MTPDVTREDLMRYLDDELDPRDRARVEAALEHSTELARELALFRGLQADLQDLSFSPPRRDTSVWGSVDRRITRPVGWLLLSAGAVIFFLYSVVVYLTSEADVWEKIGFGGIVIGFLLLLASAAIERAREYRTDPYRHIER